MRFNLRSAKDYSGFDIAEETTFVDTLLKVFDYQNLSKMYAELRDEDPLLLIDLILNKLELKYEISDEDLSNIPLSGPFIIVSNHPYKGIDSMLLYKILSEIRLDFKIMASFLLKRIKPLENVVIPVKTFETSGGIESSFPGIKEGINHIRNGHCIGMFPAGDLSAHLEVSQVIQDNEWQNVALKFIKHAEVPVIPVYFHGTNSRISYIFGKMRLFYNRGTLPSELLNKKNRTVKIRVGSAISIKDQSEFEDIAEFGRYLRARTYSLGSAIEVKKFFDARFRQNRLKPEPLISPVPSDVLAAEYKSIRAEYELFSTKNYSVVCAPTVRIPMIFTEIGRLRELTFRKVGEGTNKSSDIDEYDLYFNHLFIWDTDDNKIVGAYRIGMGKEIISIYGIKGFYFNSLFRIKNSFSTILSQSLELGRSFIREDYQKKPMPLFLLWKGIMVFLLLHKEYRYLIGPVSISNDFSKFSKSLIVEFIRKYFSDSNLSEYVVPRKEFKVKPDKVIDRSIFINTSERDINKIEKIIMNIEPGYRLPVLLKKYLEINGKIIGFNIDPNFNYCLDGLLILDLFNTPQEYIKGLSKELNDPDILERFVDKN